MPLYLYCNNPKICLMLPNLAFKFLSNNMHLFYILKYGTPFLPIAIWPNHKTVQQFVNFLKGNVFPIMNFALIFFGKDFLERVSKVLREQKTFFKLQPNPEALITLINELYTKSDISNLFQKINIFLSVVILAYQVPCYTSINFNVLVLNHKNPIFLCFSNTNQPAFWLFLEY